MLRGGTDTFAGANASVWARAVVRGRYVVVLLWVAAAAAAVVYLPGLGGSSSVTGLVREDAPALAADARSTALFGYPLSAELALVNHDPKGLSVAAQGRIAQTAWDVSSGAEPSVRGRILAAVPILDVGPLHARNGGPAGTTAVTYLFPDPTRSLESMTAAARDLGAARLATPGDGYRGATGVIPARVEQERGILDALPWISIATVLLILVALGAWQRAIGAPIVVLAAAGAAYTCAIGAIGAFGTLTGTAVPEELEPLIVVLLLGIVTDYSIFLLAAARDDHAAAPGIGHRDVVAGALARTAPTILTAGTLVAAGTATLSLGSLGFFRALGPGLALTALVGMVAALTLVPALAAIGGRLVVPTRAAAPAPAPRAPGRLGRLARHRVVAALAVLGCSAGLAYAAADLRDARLGFSLTQGLPPGSEARDAARSAAQGFPAGIISPTTVLLEGQGVAGQTTEVARLESRLRERPGIAAVIGPPEQSAVMAALPAADAAQGVPAGTTAGALPAPFASRDGNAVRLFVVTSRDPFSSDAIDAVDALGRQLDADVAAAGLHGTTASVAGETALAGQTVALVEDDMGLLIGAALLVNVLLLALFLRAIVAPVLLLGASLLALGAALGITVLCSHLLGYGDLAYYVPLAAAVLLLSLGSDYNVYVVGRIWQEARVRPLDEAIAVAAPAAAKPVNLAGAVLAGSFALLAIAPVVPLRQLAIALASGVLIDTLVVRTILVPALIRTLGRAAAWPGSTLDAPAGLGPSPGD